MFPDGRLLDTIFNLKFAARQFVKNSAKASKSENAEKLKVKNALMKGNTECAIIYAQNAIRHKNESLDMLRVRLERARPQTLIRVCAMSTGSATR